jgi:hypothetical protein
MDAAMDSKFSQAQQAYLRGRWQEAEALISEILNQRPMDVEARLLRASIQRRDARLTDAHKTLDELLNEPAAAKWQMEIRAELKQLGQVERERAVLEGAAKAA